MGRKKKIGFADLQGTRAELASGGLKCPECNRVVSDTDEMKLVPTLGQKSESSLATLNCPRCRTMISIRFIAAAS